MNKLNPSYRLLSLVLVALAAVSVSSGRLSGSWGTISGRVTFADSSGPAADVIVYLSNTTIGTSTDSLGRFILRNVPWGRYDLVVSRIGFKRIILEILLTQADSKELFIRLEPLELHTTEQQVSADIPREWRDQLKAFEAAFLGDQDKCRIVNPEVLNFSLTNDTLEARTDSILKVENRKLGYAVYVLLSQFAWNIRGDFGQYLIYPRFEELVPKDGSELRGWQENREAVYRGSIRHFLRSILKDKADEEQFSIYTGTPSDLQRGRVTVVSAHELAISPMSGTPFFTIRFPGYLRIEYGRRVVEEVERRTNYQVPQTILRGVDDLSKVSLITLKGPFAIVDSDGNLLNPLSIDIAGGWAKRRLADLIPLH